MVKFIYNNKVYAPANFKGKLKKLGISEQDVQIINDDRVTPPEKWWRKYKYQYKHAGVVIWKDTKLKKEDLTLLPGNVNDYAMYEKPISTNREET